MVSAEGGNIAGVIMLAAEVAVVVAVVVGASIGNSGGGNSAIRERSSEEREREGNEVAVR